MPNIKSSIRSVKTDAERRAKNAPIKAALRNASRKVEALAKTGAKEDAQATMATASGLLDKAARKGIIHKNAAARKNPDLQRESTLWLNSYKLTCSEKSRFLHFRDNFCKQANQDHN